MAIRVKKDDLWLPVSEAARLKRVTSEAIRVKIRNGELSSERRGKTGGVFYVRLKELDGVEFRAPNGQPGEENRR